MFSTREGRDGQKSRLIPTRVVSLHFPKAAGSSLHLQMRNLLGDAVALDFVHDPLTPAGTQKAPFPSDKRVVHGHFRAQRYASTQAYWLTFLRHPIDNLISIYFYWKSSTSASHDLHRRFLVEQPSILRFALYPGIRRLMSASYFGGFDMGRFDFIGFYETRHSDIPRLAGALGLDLLVETHANKTPVSNERHLAETDLVLRQNLKSLLVDDIRFYDRFRDRW